MCIAIVKPKNADFPTMKQLENCFNSNYHGAGFMYSDGENLVIKKGFMTFEDFKTAYLKENISKDKLVFFHFRIATHGLRDGGNTHPFPIVKDASIMRQEELKFKGFGMIHNGVFSYRDYEFKNYGSSEYISDTMLFGMKIAEKLSFKYKTANTEEEAVACYLKSKDKTLIDVIENEIGYNKVAIMNEKEEYVKFGNWIEDNGVFYSNDDYNYSGNYYGCGYYNDYSNYGLECCCCCQEYIDEDCMEETTSGMMCKTCISQFNMKRCVDCGIYIVEEDSKYSNLCDICKEGYIADKCDYCHTKLDKDHFFLTNDEQILCEDCFEYCCGYCHSH